MLAASGQKNYLLIHIRYRATKFMTSAMMCLLPKSEISPLDSSSPRKPYLWEFLPDFPDPLTLLPNDGPVEFLLND